MRNNRAVSFFFIVMCLFSFCDLKAQWTELTSNTNTTKLNSVYCTDAKTCYAVGNAGVVLKTNDGGTTWQKKTFPGTEILLNVIFPDAERGIVYSDSKLFSTDDQGNKWNYDFDWGTDKFKSISFPTTNLGYLSCSYFGQMDVFRTNCQGINPASSWNTPKQVCTNDIAASFFSDYKRGYIVTKSGEIYQTTDGHQTWDTVYYNSNLIFKAIQFTNNDTGFALATNLTLDSSFFLKSVNSGVIWNIVSNVKITVARPSTFFFTTSTIGYAGGLNGINSKGKILKTIDGGISWMVQDSTSAAVNSIFFPTSKVGYAVTKDGKILKLGSDTIPNCGVPTTLSVSALTSTSATLGWNPVSGVASYNVKYKPTSVTTWSVTTVNTSFVSVSGLTASVDYEFQVESVCTGNSGYSSSYIFTTGNYSCVAPSGLYTTGITDTTAILHWTNSVGGQAYKIRYKPQSSTAWINASSIASAGVDTITGLMPGTGYEFQVEKVCDNSNSGFSSSSTFTTTGTFSGTHEIKNSDNELTVFPNPNNGKFTLKYFSDERNATISIYDMLGNKLFSEIKHNSKGEVGAEIDILFPSKGIYFVQLKTDASVSTKRFIVE
jgi:photosystem II stability/assembly factor-like uncharacterized protein